MKPTGKRVRVEGDVIRKTVWLCLESLRPTRWAVRYGNKWYVVSRVKVTAPMKTKTGPRAPHGYLCGVGTLTIKGTTATIS